MEYKIGDKVFTEEFGDVIIRDIFISPTSGFRVYGVQKLNDPNDVELWYLTAGSFVI